MKNWVILFVRAGAEGKLTRLLKEKLDADKYLPFLPIKEESRRSRGVIYKKHKLLFPGYIFIQTEIEANLIAASLKSALIGITWHKDIYMLLHYGDDKNDVALREHERLHWERLLDANFCVTGSVGFTVGNVVRIISGALVGMESLIKKINRHKREAIIELEMMGAPREVKVMLEIIEKIEAVPFF